MKIFNLKKYFDEIGYWMAAVLFLIAIAGAFIYANIPFFEVPFAVALVSMLIGVFGAYYLLISFEKPEKPLELLPGEQRNLRTLEMGAVIFPKKLGGIMSKEMHRNVTIYLTNKRILARDVFGETLLEIPLETIKGFKVEKIIATDYIRMLYTEKGKEKDVLIFVGNRDSIDLWISRMSSFGVKEFSKFEKDSEDFLSDIEKIREKI
ncbi:MAG: hypothetical protein QW802_03510 [Candidatus Altiarchaeota archaeon]